MFEIALIAMNSEVGRHVIRHSAISPRILSVQVVRYSKTIPPKRK